jgi:hypothetical protein
VHVTANDYSGLVKVTGCVPPAPNTPDQSLTGFAALGSGAILAGLWIYEAAQHLTGN